MKAAATSLRRQIQIYIGKAGTPVGQLVYVRQEDHSYTEITDVQMLVARAAYFVLSADQALAVLAEAHAAVSELAEVP